MWAAEKGALQPAAPGVLTRTTGTSLSTHRRQLQAAPPPRRRCRRQCQQAPPAACSATSKTSGGASRHFLRPSLLATGLREPADVLQHCLALYRKADLAALQQYLPDAYVAAAAADDAPPAPSDPAAPAPAAAPSSRLPPRGPPLPVGPWFRLVESGPLAPLAGLLDVGARRVLPGHLLRRSQVLSTLRPSPDAFQQRVALTACSGETSVFEWRLQWEPAEGGQDAQQQQQQQQPQGNGGAADGGSGSSSSSSGGRGRAGRWVLESVRRDASSDSPLPTTPHPKAAPEAIIKAQLAALQQGDVLNASSFSSWRGQPKAHVASRRTGLGFHHEALRQKLRQEPYGLLLRHAAAQLGTAALPSQREMLQEVAVLAADGASARFLWRLGIGPQGCWMVTGIFSDHDVQNTDWQQHPHV